MRLSSSIRATLSVLLLVPFLSGCGLLFVNGPTPGWQNASNEDLETMALTQPCTNSKTVPIIDGAVIRTPKMRVPSEEVGLPLVQELHNRHVPFRAREPERRRARLRDLVDDRAHREQQDDNLGAAVRRRVVEGGDPVLECGVHQLRGLEGRPLITWSV